MRKFFTLMFAVMLTAQAWAQTTFTIGQLEYTVTDDTNHYVSVGAVDYDIVGDIVIPSIVEKDGVSYTVKSVHFAYREGLTSITIPNSVESIGYSAFNECIGLTSVTIPNSVTSIGENAFADCESLTSITIPNSVESIGETAFVRCESLTSITIPNSVESIGSKAFYGCSGLTEINVSSNNANYTSENGVLFNKDKTTIICYPARKSDTAFTIPNSVTNISDGAFLDCDNLSKAEFASIEHLLEIDFEYYDSNPLSCAHHLYIGGTEVTELAIPNTIDSIGDYTFAGCEGLTSVTIPNTVTSIGEGAFYDCYNITSITIPHSVTSIGKKAFGYCYNISSITIPNSVTSIGGGAFEDAFSIVKNIIYSGNAEGSPWGALTINGIIDGDFIYADAEKTKLTGYIGNGGDIVIPDAVVNIGRYAFYHCTKLKSVTIPKSVKTVGYYAFAGCVATIYCDFKERPNGWDYNWDGTRYNWDGSRYNIYQGNIIWQTATPVTETAANAVSIYAYGNTIVVENATDEISVYNVMGTLVCRDVARNVSTVAKSGVRTELQVNGTGVYIVKVGNIAKRVMVND